MYNTFHHVMIGTCQTAVHVNYTIAASFYNFIIGGVEVGFAVVSGSSVGICKRSRSLCVFFRSLNEAAAQTPLRSSHSARALLSAAPGSAERPGSPSPPTVHRDDGTTKSATERRASVTTGRGTATRHGSSMHSSAWAGPAFG